jgi:lipoate synthase
VKRETGFSGAEPILLGSKNQTNRFSLITLRPRAIPINRESGRENKMIEDRNLKTYTRKPPWLKKRLPTGATYEKVRGLLKKRQLHTVCQEAKCPNLWECFSCQTATFLIMGSYCTRNCRFCAVGHGPTRTLGPARS